MWTPRHAVACQSAVAKLKINNSADTCIPRYERAVWPSMRGVRHSRRSVTRRAPRIELPLRHRRYGPSVGSRLAPDSDAYPMSAPACVRERPIGDRRGATRAEHAGDSKELEPYARCLTRVLLWQAPIGG